MNLIKINWGQERPKGVKSAKESQVEIVWKCDDRFGIQLGNCLGDHFNE